MNNNLSENLKKIRKDNNLSQEQLAEELGVSRQAISKWESGVAYPEMEKIIQLCDKFDMNIDDLLHRDIREIKGEEISKNNVNKFIESFLSFITDTINLFSNMNFKSKIKCLFEQIVIAITLFIILFIIGILFGKLVFGLFHLLPYNVYSFIYELLGSVYLIFAIGVALGILIYIFKTRYLNYYSKIKKEYIDSESKTENIELKDLSEDKNMDDSKLKDLNKIMFKRNENKIIIRDPKHSEYKFINGIFKMFILGIKFFALIGLLFCCFVLVGLFVGIVLSFAVAKTGLFFIGLLLTFVSASIIDIVVILLILNFIFNRKNDKKKMVWAFIVSVVVLGIGCGMTLLGSLNFDYIDKESLDDSIVETKTINFSMNDNLFFNEYHVIEYVEKDIDNVIVEYKINKLCKLDYNKSDKYGIHFYDYCSNPMSLIRQFISNLNDKKIIDVNNEIIKVKVYASKSNIEKLKSNLKNYNEHENAIQSQFDAYEKTIDKYAKELEDYKNKTNDYENEINELKDEISAYKNIDND